MKTLFLTILTLSLGTLRAQDYKRDLRTPEQKEYIFPGFQVDEINKHDLIQALELTGISINKFKFGKFDTTRHLTFFIEEFSEGKKVRTDTIFRTMNTYNHYPPQKEDKEDDEDETYYFDYQDEFKLFTHRKDSLLTFQFKTYVASFGKIVKLKKTAPGAYYNLRIYKTTNWQLYQSVPLLVYASSWTDPKYPKIQRFCGVSTLSKNSEGTIELLTNSPHYFVVNYIIY